MFDGFETHDVATPDATIHLRIGGSGPPLLLLHGYPQTHAMWHKVAPSLAEDFTVVAADLRGYGDSSKPEGDAEHARYSKRAMAADQVAAMRHLGFERFAVAGHDRGGRVAHRLALDHPDRVTRLAVLDIVATEALFRKTDKAFALGYYHWFFLAQPFDLPEQMIGADPVFFLERKMGHWSATGAVFSDEAMAEYRRCFSDPATIHASCEDYRAAATIDLAHDAADNGRRVAAPTLALWGRDGFMERTYDVLAEWREKCDNVEGRALPSGHFLAEEEPEETTAELRHFFLED